MYPTKYPAMAPSVRIVMIYSSLKDAPYIMPRSCRLLLYVHHLLNIVSYLAIKGNGKIYLMEETLLKLLSDYGITQRELSEELKCNPSNISQYMQGIKRMSKKNFIRMLHGLDGLAKKREIDCIKLQMQIQEIIRKSR